MREEMTAGTECPKCGGQVMRQWQQDRENRGAWEQSCIQCGYEPGLPRPGPEDLVRLHRQTISEGMSHKGLPAHRVTHYGDESPGPDFFRCTRPGCGVWTFKTTPSPTRPARKYCSRDCWYLHRPEVGPKPPKRTLGGSF